MRVELKDVVLRPDVVTRLLRTEEGTVQVNVRDGAPTTVYEGPDPGDPSIANPLPLQNGRIEGWVEQGSYDLAVAPESGSGYTDRFEAVSGASMVLLESGEILFQDGSVAEPGITFASDPDTGLVRLSANRMGLVTGGLVGAYINSDGALIVVDVANDIAAGHLNTLLMGSGTSAGSVISGHNRFFRSFSFDRSTTVRLIGVGNGDHVVIGGEFGTNPSIILRGTGYTPPEIQLNGKVKIYQDDAQTRVMHVFESDGDFIFQRAGGLSARLMWRNNADTTDLAILKMSGDNLDIARDNNVNEIQLWGPIAFYDSDGSNIEQFRLSAAGIPQWKLAANNQTTVGAAGGASAPPATPTKYLKVIDSSGTTLVIPAYAAA